MIRLILADNVYLTESDDMGVFLHVGNSAQKIPYDSSIAEKFVIHLRNLRKLYKVKEKIFKLAEDNFGYMPTNNREKCLTEICESLIAELVDFPESINECINYFEWRQKIMST